MASQLTQSIYLLLSTTRQTATSQHHAHNPTDLQATPPMGPHVGGHSFSPGVQMQTPKVPQLMAPQQMDRMPRSSTLPKNHQNHISINHQMDHAQVSYPPPPQLSASGQQQQAMAPGAQPSSQPQQGQFVNHPNLSNNQPQADYSQQAASQVGPRGGQLMSSHNDLPPQQHGKFRLYVSRYGL